MPSNCYPSTYTQKPELRRHTSPKEEKMKSTRVVWELICLGFLLHLYRIFNNQVLYHQLFLYSRPSTTIVCPQPLFCVEYLIITFCILSSFFILCTRTCIALGHNSKAFGKCFFQHITCLWCVCVEGCNGVLCALSVSVKQLLVLA